MQALRSSGDRAAAAQSVIPLSATQLSARRATQGQHSTSCLLSRHVERSLHSPALAWRLRRRLRPCCRCDTRLSNSVAATLSATGSGGLSTQLNRVNRRSAPPQGDITTAEFPRHTPAPLVRLERRPASVRRCTHGKGVQASPRQPRPAVPDGFSRFFVSGGQTATSDPNGQLSGPAGARSGAAAAR